MVLPFPIDFRIRAEIAFFPEAKPCEKLDGGGVVRLDESFYSMKL